MNVYKRPLFRQAGGPAQPMPQDMMMPPQGAPMPSQGAPMPPEAQQLQAVEQQAAMQGEQIGQQYATDMISNLDMAETPEDVINAIRGNQKPLDARYMELAQFVGEEDAVQTPESVLAFVQPVIMMTEQGAMDSGIGELMQGLMGDTEMSGDMAGGVGSLMAAGAQEAPVPQNFNQGGAVQSFALGGIAMPSAFVPMLNEDQGAPSSQGAFAQPVEAMSTTPEPRSTDQELSSESLMSNVGLRSYYNEMLPLYKEMISDNKANSDYNKAQTYFDIAKAGLALASGTDPRTGQNMANRPFAAQLAQAASMLPESIQARAAEQRKLEMGAKSGALDLASKFAAQDRSAAMDYETALAKAAIDRGSRSPEYKVAVGDNGETLGTFNVNDPRQQASLEALVAEGAKVQNPSAQARPKRTSHRVMYTDGSRQIFSSLNDGVSYITPDGTEIEPPSGSDVLSIIELSPENAAAVQDKDQSVNRYQKLLAEAQGKKPEEKTEIDYGLTAINPADQSRLQATAAVYKDKLQEATGEPVSNTDLQGAFTFINDNGVAQVVDAYTAALGGTGPKAYLESTLNQYFGAFSELDPEDLRREQFRQYLRAIRFIGKVALVQNSRFPVAEMALASDLFPDPDRFFQDPEVAAEKIQSIRAITADLRMKNLQLLASPSTPAKDRQEAEAGLRDIEMLFQLLGPMPERMSPLGGSIDNNPLMRTDLDTSNAISMGFKE